MNELREWAADELTPIHVKSLALMLRKTMREYERGRLLRNQAIVAAYRQGFSCAEIGELTGLSRQRVHQIVQDH